MCIRDRWCTGLETDEPSEEEIEFWTEVFEIHRSVMGKSSSCLLYTSIIFGWRKDGKHKWYGDQKQKAVFEFDGIKNSKENGHGHPSSKPVPLIAYLIKQSTQVNGIVPVSYTRLDV